MLADHIILLGAFIDQDPELPGEPLLQVRCSCGVILLESGDGGDEMVTLFEIQEDAKKHFKTVLLREKIDDR
jgi:hypothetical protein